MRDWRFIPVFAVALLLTAFGYANNKSIRDFTLPNANGDTLSTKNFGSAKGLIVIFTCNHCPFSVAYEDRIIALHSKYASQGYPVLAINPNDAVQYPDDSYPEMQKRAKDKGFAFGYLHDETQEVAKLWGAERTPHVYIVKKEK